jgi:hypothetical protein
MRSAYTPPEAPITFSSGSSIDVPSDPVTWKHCYTSTYHVSRAVSRFSKASWETWDNAPVAFIKTTLPSSNGWLTCIYYSPFVLHVQPSLILLDLIKIILNWVQITKFSIIHHFLFLRSRGIFVTERTGKPFRELFLGKQAETAFQNFFLWHRCNTLTLRPNFDSLYAFRNFFWIGVLRSRYFPPRFVL